MAWIGAAIGAGASLLGGMNASDASSAAAGAQVQASQAAIAEQQREFNLQQANNAPFLATGTAANQRLAVLLGLQRNAGTGGSAGTTGGTPAPTQAQFMTPGGFGPASGGGGETGGVSVGDPLPATPNVAAYQAALAQWQAGQPTAAATTGTPDAGYGSLVTPFAASDLAADPVYNAGLNWGADQGSKAIGAAALANGSYDSGATLKALTQFGNDYGTTKAQQAYNDFNANQTNTYNRLAGVSGAGQVAANTIADAGSASAGSISNLLTGAGNATAAGIVGGANAYNTAAGGVNSAVNNYQNSTIMNKIFGLNNGSSSGSLYNGFTGLDSGGGPAYGNADGGLIDGPGTGTSDSIPRMLSKGEYVVPADVVRKKGAGFFHHLTAKHHIPARRAA